MIPVYEHIFVGQNLYERTVMPVCREYGLTYMEFTVLMFLHNNPQFDTAAQIVKIRKLTKSHVSISIKGLQAHGLVQGVYFPGNQKTLHLQITEAAKPVVEAGLAAQKEFGAILARDFTPEELEQLRCLIDKLSKNIIREEEHG